MLSTHKLYSLINFSSTAFRDIKQSLLNNFCNKWKDLPLQGSKEWQEERCKSVNIGGSDMSSVLRVNKYNKYESWVANKVGLGEPFTGNVNTRWGKIFEDIGIKIVEVVLDTHIHETGSIPCEENPRIKYSPDGLGIVKLKCSGIIEDKPIDTNEYLYVLFEFKSPASTIPDGKVPTHYLPQVLTGMCALPHVDVSLFVNCMYRKCSIGDLGYNNKYDTYFHRYDATKKLTLTKPIAIGMVYFYQTDEQYDQFVEEYGDDESDCDMMDFADKFMNGYNTSLIDRILSKQVIDFGAANMAIIGELFEMYDKKMINVSYDTYIIPNELHQIQFLVAQGLANNMVDVNDIECGINNIKQKITSLDHKIGYLPWKMFKMDIIPVIKDPNYLNSHKAEIDNAIEDIDHVICGADDIITRSARYNAKFKSDDLMDADMCCMD